MSQKLKCPRPIRLGGEAGFAVCLLNLQTAVNAPGWRAWRPPRSALLTRFSLQIDAEVGTGRGWKGETRRRRRV